MIEIEVIKLKVIKEKELLADLPSKQIKSPSDVVSILRQLIGEEDREHFIIILLDTKMNINGVHTVSIGSLNSALVHPREVFKVAVMRNAGSIILGHNHPSGDPRPSNEDKRITDRLIEGGKLLGIEVLDHIVIGEERSYYSFKEEGLM